MVLSLVFGLVTVPLAHANADSSNKAELIQKQLKRFYHADGYIKAIGKNAHRTIYSSNNKIRHKWVNAVRWLMKVRANASHNLYLLRHPQPIYNANYWINRQIEVAEKIAHSSTNDPWPNCPDPVFNGAASWQDTVNCENSGNWYDSSGYYRCGLQFDPSWESRYGRLCP